MGRKFFKYPNTIHNKAFCRIKYCPNCKQTVIALEYIRLVNKENWVMIDCPNCGNAIGLRHVLAGDEWMTLWM